LLSTLVKTPKHLLLICALFLLSLGSTGVGKNLQYFVLAHVKQGCKKFTIGKTGKIRKSKTNICERLFCFALADSYTIGYDEEGNLTESVFIA